MYKYDFSKNLRKYRILSNIGKVNIAIFVFPDNLARNMFPNPDISDSVFPDIYRYFTIPMSNTKICTPSRKSDDKFQADIIFTCLDLVGIKPKSINKEGQEI